MSHLEERLLLQIVAAGLPVPAREWRPFPELGYRFDLAWPEKLIAAEVEGGTWVNGRHQRGAGYAEDCRKYNLAVLLHWQVLRFTGEMIADGGALAMLEAAFGKREPAALIAEKAAAATHRRRQAAKLAAAARQQKEKA